MVYASISKNLRNMSIPYVIIPHGELRREAQCKKVIVNLSIFNRFIKGVRAIQCLSNFELQNTKWEIRKFLGTNGAELPKKHESSFNECLVNFIYVGRYEWKVKGLDILLDTIKK